MQHIVEQNGDITFMAEMDVDDLLEILDSAADKNHGFLVELMDRFGYQGNGIFEAISPEDIGALTDAPMFSDGVEFTDDGQREVTGTVWWFPNYALESFAETLVQSGKVTFQRAH